MNSSTLDSLLTAKRLLVLSNQECYANNRHSCTAGIILLHDALELVLLSCLAEKEIQIKEHAHLDKLINEVEKIFN